LVASVVVFDESAVVFAGELVVLAAGELVVLAAGEVDAIGVGVGDADFLAAFAARGRQQAKAAAQAGMKRSLFFIGQVGFGILVVSGSKGERNGGCGNLAKDRSSEIRILD